MNRFTRTASNYAYYGYLTRYTPASIRTYQSDRHYFLGRRGAFNNLVLKMAADHINYEEDLNLRYKVPPFISNISMRLAMFWFASSIILLSFCLGDMIKIFNISEFYYPNKPSTEAEVYNRYETMYFVDRAPRY